MRKGRQAVKGLTNEQKQARKEQKKKEQAEIKKEQLKRAKEMNIGKPKKLQKKIILNFFILKMLIKRNWNGKHIFIDPGKQSLLTMMDDDGKFVSYTNREHIHRTKRLEYQKFIKKFKDKENISQRLKNTLSLFNSKTCNIDKFKEYMAKKISINEILYAQYEKPTFRKYKWYGYINKKTSRR